MKYLPIHFSSSIWLRDNLWTNLNQFCANISTNIMELIVFITHIWLYGRFYISEFTCFSFFPPTPVAIHGHVSRNFCCDCIGYCESWGTLKNMGVNFHCTHRAYFLLHPPPSIKYCTYTLIISSDFSEALNSE